MITARKPGSWIGEHFPKCMTERQMLEWRNIWWRVCVSHIPPRSERFEFERDFGCGKLEAILEHQPLNLKPVCDGGYHLLLMFPERHLSTQEEYVLVPLLAKHPEIREMKLIIIDIVTKSPLIVGNFLKDDVRIISEEGKGGIDAKTQTAWNEMENLSKRPKSPMQTLMT